MADDRDAGFTRILSTWGTALERLAAVYAREPADREDLVQEICFAIWRAWPSFRGDCSERTFVYRIAHNRGLSHRARHHRRLMEPLEEHDTVSDPAADPERDLDRVLSRERLLEAVQRLPDPLRQVTALSLAGLSPGEIADVVGITENNAAVRLSRARRALRELL